MACIVFILDCSVQDREMFDGHCPVKIGFKDPGVGKNSLYILLLISVSFLKKILVEFLNKYTENQLQ